MCKCSFRSPGCARVCLGGAAHVPDPGLPILLWLLASALIAIGLAGLVLPGISLIYAGVVLLAWAEDFAYVGWLTHTFPGQAGVGAVLGLFSAPS